MNAKREYIETIKNELSEWQEEIYKLRVFAEETGWEDPDRQMEYYQIIEDTVNQHQIITDRLSALEELDIDKWQAEKEEIEAIMKKTAAAITTARSTVA